MREKRYCFFHNFTDVTMYNLEDQIHQAIKSNYDIPSDMTYSATLSWNGNKKYQDGAKSFRSMIVVDVYKREAYQAVELARPKTKLKSVLEAAISRFQNGQGVKNTS